MPFLSLANQKRYIALHHIGLYADPQATAWVRDAYAATDFPLDMGKSCIRFNNMAKNPHRPRRPTRRPHQLEEFLDTYRESRRSPT